MDRDGQTHPHAALRHECRQGVLQFMLQQAHAVDVLAQTPAGLRGPTRLLAHHQGAARPRFQEPHARGHG